MCCRELSLETQTLSVRLLLSRELQKGTVAVCLLFAGVVEQGFGRRFCCVGGHDGVWLHARLRREKSRLQGCLSNRRGPITHTSCVGCSCNTCTCLGKPPVRGHCSCFAELLTPCSSERAPHTQIVHTPEPYLFVLCCCRLRQCTSPVVLHMGRCVCVCAGVRWSGQLCPRVVCVSGCQFPASLQSLQA